MIAGGYAASGAALQSQVRESIRGIVAKIDLGHAVTIRTDAGVEADGSWIHVGIPALLKLAEAVPAEAQGVDQLRVENVNLADGKVISNGRGHAEPGIQLRTTPRPGAAARKFIFTGAVEVARRERIGGREGVINLQDSAVWRLTATVVDDERTRQTQ